MKYNILKWFSCEYERLFSGEKYTDLSKIKQVSFLYSSTILNIFIGIAVSVFNARILGPEQYGKFKFLQGIFSFAVTFLTAGVFVTGGRLLALTRERTKQREIIAALSLLVVMISILLMIVVLLFSFYENSIFGYDLGFIIRCLTPFLFLFPLRLCLDRVLIGLNSIYALSLLRITPQFLYLLIAFTFSMSWKIDLLRALVFQFFSSCLVLSGTLVFLKARFKNIDFHLHELFRRNKNHGLQVYFGSLFSIAGAQLTGILIGYYLDAESVGYYSLAIMVATPLSMIPNAVATCFYREFCHSVCLPKKITAITCVISIFILTFFLVFIKYIVLFLYSEKYMVTIDLAYIISFGCIFYGLGDYINKFIGSHGKGIYTRNCAFIVGMVNIIGSVFLIKFFGIKGAAVTKLVSGVVYFIIIVFYYKKLLVTLNPKIASKI